MAILWSVASDQWLNPLSFETHRISSLDATFAIERRMLHHAFTMQQIPVDYLDDVDLPTRLQEYQVLYLPVFWNVFPAAELAMIADPVIRAGALPPVSTQVGVDAARLDGPAGIAVTLANYTLEPIADLSLLVRDIRSAGSVSSAVRGPLAHRFTAEGLVVNLPLDVVDVVMIKP